MKSPTMTLNTRMTNTLICTLCLTLLMSCDDRSDAVTEVDDTASADTERSSDTDHLSAADSNGSDTALGTDSDTQPSDDTESDSQPSDDTALDTDTPSDTDRANPGDCRGLDPATSSLCFPDLEIDAGSSAMMEVFLVLPERCTQVTQTSGFLKQLPAGVTLTTSTPPMPTCIRVTDTGFQHLTQSASWGCENEYLYEGIIATMEFNVAATTAPGVYDLEVDMFYIGDNATDADCRANSNDGDSAYAGKLTVR